MHLCAAQLEPLTGDVAGNVRKHLSFVDAAAAGRADLVIFPELSLTGYEPELAAALATSHDDARLDPFQQAANDRRIVIGVGIPTRASGGIRISMVVFRPNQNRLAYAKQLLHSDETAYFVGGDEQVILRTNGHTLAPAICYESLQPHHAAESASVGADVYLASVAKPARDLAKAYAHYAGIARRHSMTVLMANALGRCDDFVSGGGSAIWNDRGELVVSMQSDTEGIAMIDTATGEGGILLP